jgi:PAS domain S-box-containing protein
VPLASLVAGGIAMAAAIAGMHYTGMLSMEMPASIRWNPYLVVASIVIALAAAFGALVIMAELRQGSDLRVRLMAAALMGFAIAGMHYTGMLAATFVPAPLPSVDANHILVTSGMEIAVIAAPLLILAIALGSSIVQRRWALASRRAETILGQSEERYRRLVDAVKDYAIFMLDPNGCVSTWNAGAERISGYTAGEVLGKHASMFSTPEELESRLVERELRQAAASGHFESEARRRRKNGTTFWARITVTPCDDPPSRTTGFCVVCRDVTAIKESEQRMLHLNEELEQRVRNRTIALAERERQLRSITSAVPVLLAQLDRNERLLFVNEAFCRWFRRPEGETIGRSLRELASDYDGIRPFLERALHGEQVSFERDVLTDGQRLTFQATYVPELDPRGAVQGLILVAMDITKQREIRDELNAAKEAAEVANQTKSAFLANMSHEIRTPLGAVLGFAELLLGGDMTPAERQDCMEIIKRNGRLLSTVINDILDLSKVEAGKLEIERVEVPFPEMMKEIGSVLDLDASERGIELRITADGPLPAHIRTDPLRLRQVLFNLIGNAIKFTHSGSVVVRIERRGVDRQPPKLAFVITDTGVGIPPDKVARLFTPFTQADASTTRRFGGTGLGLVLCKRLAQALGGDVELTATTPGRGSTFTVTIDPGLDELARLQTGHRRRQDHDARKDANASVRGVDAAAPPTEARAHDLSHLRILLADDSLDNQLLIKRVLGRAGAAVETASNGREAVDKALSEPFSLVLMDLQMPEMDGYEAARTLRRRGYGKPSR